MSELLDGKFLFTNYSLHFSKMLRHRGSEEKKKAATRRIFFVEGWIVMNFGLLILHKIKVLII